MLYMVKSNSVFEHVLYCMQLQAWLQTEQQGIEWAVTGFATAALVQHGKLSTDALKPIRYAHLLCIPNEAVLG